MLIRGKILALILVVPILFACKTTSGQNISADQLKFFESKIRPVLVRECYSCHSDQAGQRKGGLRVDTKARLEVGGDSGPAIVPGDAAESLLLSAINHEDYVMPPRKKLSDREIADFRSWIEMGAPDPRKTKTTKAQSTVSNEDIKKGRQFWSFKRPKSSSVPNVEQLAWVRNPIDNFILAKLSDENLVPNEDADPNSLLRRLTFDLIGLPPTPEQVSWFEKKWAENPDAAIARVVDRLLDNNQFGERWGRHWLDVARYAESSGREVNATFPNAWRYRDYVIDSFNADKPYDEFIQEQLAGDLLPAKTDEQWTEHLIATGFLAIGPKTLAEQNARQFSLDLVDEQIDVSTRVILGVSVACARCHDHKFDPIQQKDYYAIAGIFESTNTYYGTIDTPQNRRPSRQIIMPVQDSSEFDLRLTMQEVNQLNSQIATLRDELEVLQIQRREARRNGNDDKTAQQSLANINRTVTRIAALENRLYSVDESGNPKSFCMGVQDKDKPLDSKLLVRGEFDQPDGIVQRGFVQVLSKQNPRIKPNESGRLQLAKWMTDKSNPLTARVMVNRIWQHLMGVGIVQTPENFGATGMQPTHPELLDYLATEFMNSNWSVKQMIREIVNSHCYRISATMDTEKFESDPNNDFRWRANPRQLDAESLRDSMLMASGSLDLQRPRASIVAEAGMTLVREGRMTSFQPTSMNDDSMDMMQSSRQRRRQVKVYNIDNHREFRTVYLPVVRDSLPRALEVFDFAEPGMVVGKRETSNTPTQGLYLLNNSFVMRQSKALAERIMKEADTTRQQIELAFLYAYGRDATEEEVESALAFYGDYDVEEKRRRRRKRDSDWAERTKLKKLSALAHAILASAEFRYTN